MEKITTSMRLPRALKDQIDSAAKASGRSLTQEIERRLEQSFRADEVIARLERIEALVRPPDLDWGINNCPAFVDDKHPDKHGSEVSADGIIREVRA